MTPGNLFLPSTLARLTVRDWQFPPHLQALERACLRLLTDPTCNRLIVEMPVRHGKSHYCSWILPAWFLLLWPDRQVILSTYQSTFAAEWSHRVQGTVRDYGPQLTGAGLGEIRRRDRWTTNAAGGGFRTSSPGSGVAGKGADLIIADDLVKDQKEVGNPARRHSLDTWCNAELLARLEPQGKVLVVMSRRHPDDQSGRFLAQNTDLPPAQRWHVIRMPAISEEGSALWPDRYSLEQLLAIKRRYELAGMSYLWSCLFQQDPTGDTSLVEWPAAWFDGLLYDELPPGLPIRWRLLTLDPSKGKDAKRGDYSSWSDLTVDGQGTRWVTPTLLVAPTSQIEEHTVELLRAIPYDALLVECNGFQEAVADNIVARAQASGVRCPLLKHYSSENKTVRIRLDLTPQLAQGRIRINGRSPQAALALGQLREFPTASHDDFPDSLSMGERLIRWLESGQQEANEAESEVVWA